MKTFRAKGTWCLSTGLWWSCLGPCSTSLRYQHVSFGRGSARAGAFFDMITICTICRSRLPTFLEPIFRRRLLIWKLEPICRKRLLTVFRREVTITVEDPLLGKTKEFRCQQVQTNKYSVESNKKAWYIRFCTKKTQKAIPPNFHPGSTCPENGLLQVMSSKSPTNSVNTPECFLAPPTFRNGLKM